MSVRWDALIQEDDNTFLVQTTCDLCRGGDPTDGCTCCQGFDCEWIDLGIVLRNIAVAGALTQAHSDGWRSGSRMVLDLWNAE